RSRRTMVKCPLRDFHTRKPHPGVIAEGAARQTETVPQPANEILEQRRSRRGVLVRVGDRAALDEEVADGEGHPAAQAAGGIAEAEFRQTRQAQRHHRTGGKMVAETEAVSTRQKVADTHHDSLAHQKALGLLTFLLFESPQYNY